MHDKETNLEQMFKAIALQKLKIRALKPKIEDGAFSWGLGPQCRKGVLGQVFNDLLKLDNRRVQKEISLVAAAFYSISICFNMFFDLGISAQNGLNESKKGFTG